jgi:K+-sensing histidine kinase KdpD
MTPAAAESEIAAKGERRKLLSELFHALNQPLTTLRCALELSLQRPRHEEEYRQTMQAVLLQAEKVTRLTSGIRELLEADDLGGHPQAVALDDPVREAVLDWLPVAEAARIALSYQCPFPCQVRFEPQGLRRALFHLMEFVMHSAARGTTVKLDLFQQEAEAVIRIAISQKEVSAAPADPAEPNMERLQRKLALAIASSIFQGAGGRLAVAGGKELRLEIRMALAEGPAEAEQSSSGWDCMTQR